MDIYWALLLASALFFGWKGYRSGLLIALGRVAAFVCAYVVAFKFSTPFAALIATHTSVNGLLALICAGVILFVGSSLAVGWSVLLMSKLLPSDNEKPSRLSSLLGGMVGLAVGAVLGLSAIFFSDYLQAILPKQNTQVLAANNSIPDQVHQSPTSEAQQLAKSFAGTTVIAVGGLAGMDSSTVQLSNALVTEPEAMVSSVQAIAQDPSAQRLFSDPHNQQVLASGDMRAIAELPDFQALQDSQALAELSLLADIHSPQEQIQLDNKIMLVFSRMTQMKNDEELQELLSDPYIQQQLQQKNSLALISDPRFINVASRVWAGQPEGSSDNKNSGNNDAFANFYQQTEEAPNSVLDKGNDATKDGAEATMYRWQDQYGNWHFSDKAPDQPDSK